MAIAAGLIAVFTILLCIMWLWPAFQFLQRYRTQITQPDLHNRSQLTISGTTVHVYGGLKPSGTVLIIIPGLHPSGIFDPRFISFANTCSEAGFQVVAPDIEEFRNFQISEGTFKKILQLVDALPAALDLRNKRLGVLGISYGAGPAFFIASKHRVAFVASIGGYYNLEHAIEFSFSGVHGNVKRNPHQWGRLIFALNHAEEILPAPDSQILKEALQLRLQLKENEATVREARLSDTGKQLLDGILKGLTPEQVQLFRKIAHKQEREALDLSPESFLNTIDRSTVLYLLHGISDDSIPYEESIELRDAATKAGFRTHCLITTVLTHVDVTSPRHLIEFVKLLHWIRLLLQQS